MWPTFYIPNAGGSGIIDADISYICGTFSIYSNSPLNLANPDGIEDGDAQFVLLTMEYNTFPTFPTSGTDWRLIFDSAVITSPAGSAYGTANIGNPRQMMWWRIYNTGDANFSATVPGGYCSVNHMSVIVKNQNDEDPMFGGAMVVHVNQGPTHTPYGTAQFIEAANQGDLGIFIRSPYQSDSSDLPNAGEYEFACSGSTSTPYAGHITIGALARHNANNLLLGTADGSLSHWTYTGLTRSTPAVSGGRKPRWAVTMSSSTSLHYMEQEVYLTAGEHYRFFVATEMSQSFPNAPNVGITYVAPDATEHGMGFTGNGGAPYYYPSGSSISSTSDDLSVPVRYGDSGASSRGGLLSSIMIHPSTSGTYKLRLYVADWNTDPFTSHAGNTNCHVYIGAAGLNRCNERASIPFFTETTDSAVENLPYLMPVVPTNPDNSNGQDWSHIVMRRSGGARPKTKLFNPMAREWWVDFDDTEISNTETRSNTYMTPAVALGTNSVVYEYLSQKKFYWEMTPVSWGTGAADNGYCVGMCPFQAVNSNLGSNSTYNVTGDWPGQYAYTSTGNTYTNGVLDGATVTGWSLADVIGVGINFTDWEITFYRNGTLLKTMTINAGQRYQLWSGLIGAFTVYSHGKNPNFTYNFRGPFSYKPPGFVAFDFDNEVA